MSLAALLLASASLLLAGLSLGWQVGTYLLSGARVRVEIRRALIAWGPDLEEVVQITARNVGRHSVGLTSCSLVMEDGRGLFAIDPHPVNPRLPATLEAHHDFSFVYAADDLRRQLASAGMATAAMRGRFALATGKTVTSREAVTLG